MSRSKVMYGVVALIALGAVSYYVLRSAAEDHEKNPGLVTSSTSTRDRATPLDSKRSKDSAPAHDAGLVKAVENPDDPITSKFLLTMECYYARLGIKRFQAIANCQNLASRQEYAHEYGECLKRWDEDQATITRFQRQVANLHCPSDADLVSTYYYATKEAARHGDPSAQMCYLQSNFPGFDERSHYTEQDFADFKASSPAYIRDAFQRGDWRIVQLLSYDHRGGITGMAIGIPDFGTPNTRYKMLSLLRLAAIGEYANQLDSQIDGLVRPDEKQNPELTRSMIDDD